MIVTTHSPILPDLIPNSSLYACRKEDGHTIIKSFSTLSPLMRQDDINEALDAESDELSVSSRILRGDFDV